MADIQLIQNGEKASVVRNKLNDNATNINIQINQQQNNITNLISSVNEIEAKQIYFTAINTSAFPTVGNLQTVYIDTTNTVSYYWDDDNLKYYPSTQNINDITLINGGSSVE